MTEWPWLHFWVFHTLPVRAMTGNAAEVHLAEILQRIETALAGPPTPAAQQAAAKDAQFAHVALQARIAAFEKISAGEGEGKFDKRPNAGADWD